MRCTTTFIVAAFGVGVIVAGSSRGPVGLSAEATQRSMAARSSAASPTSSTVSYCPANDAAAPSSPIADERTATRSPRVTDGARRDRRGRLPAWAPRMTNAGGTARPIATRRDSP